MIGLLTFLAATSTTTIQLEGWKLELGAGVIEDPSWSAAKLELTRQLQGIKRVVGESALAKLQKVTIWVNSKSEITTCMAYHPGREWLIQHKANPDMAKGVELGNCATFTSWTIEQPWMVMHELAHAYHDQFLDQGFSNPDVLETFNKSMKDKRYDSVLHWAGAKSKHYAASNQMEFFAETTESYFGTNDFYPFVRAELMNFDPDAFQLMKRIWGDPVKRTGVGK
jgi:hypothetical protein